VNLEPLETKSDRRGTLVEAFKLPNDGQIFYVIAKPSETRGNHFHLRKTEHFLVLWGSAQIQAKDRETGTVMKVELGGQNPMTATIAPNTTHNITSSEEGCIFLVWCDEQYNEADSDTYPEEI
jgi:UDP-2-acetamido-2,6-beta-L-arabino-hexul-4-ose reductase